MKLFHITALAAFFIATLGDVQAQTQPPDASPSVTATPTHMERTAVSAPTMMDDMAKMDRDMMAGQ